MAQNRYKLEEDIKLETTGYIRGYERRKRLYQEKREEILQRGGSDFARLPDKAALPGRPTEARALALAQLEESALARKLRAVEQGLLAAAGDIADESQRQLLMRGLLYNCENGRDYPFEYLGLDTFSRSDFYRRKARFLYEVAQYAGLLAEELPVLPECPRR